MSSERFIIKLLSQATGFGFTYEDEGKQVPMAGSPCHSLKVQELKHLGQYLSKMETRKVVYMDLKNLKTTINVGLCIQRVGHRITHEELMEAS